MPYDSPLQLPQQTGGAKLSRQNFELSGSFGGFVPSLAIQGSRKVHLMESRALSRSPQGLERGGVIFLMWRLFRDGANDEIIDILEGGACGSSEFPRARAGTAEDLGCPILRGWLRGGQRLYRYS